MLVEIIVGKNTGDVAARDRAGLCPNRWQDADRGERLARLLRQPLRALRFTAEGLEMLKEGVPPAMIENTARMAGMPVGPLSLSGRGRARSCARRS